MLYQVSCPSTYFPTRFFTLHIQSDNYIKNLIKPPVHPASAPLQKIAAISSQTVHTTSPKLTPKPLPNIARRLPCNNYHHHLDHVLFTSDKISRISLKQHQPLKYSQCSLVQRACQSSNRLIFPQHPLLALFLIFALFPIEQSLSGKSCLIPQYQQRPLPDLFSMHYHSWHHRPKST